MAAARFLASTKVTPEAIVDIHATRTAAAAQGRRIVAVQDTTEVNFSGRHRRRKGLGPAGDGKSPCFFIHAAVAVDADSEQLLGVLDAESWTRPQEGKRKRRQTCRAEEKETMRWIKAMKMVRLRLLRPAAKIIHITDREGDFYATLARVPEGDDLIIRTRYNRRMPEGGTLFEQADSWPSLGESEIAVPPRGPGDKPRKARVALRASRVRIGKPESKVHTPDPVEIGIGLVEVREIDPPAGVKPVRWRLLTTLPVPGRGARCGAQERVCPARRPPAALHQWAEGHPHVDAVGAVSAFVPCSPLLRRCARLKTRCHGNEAAVWSQATGQTPGPRGPISAKTTHTTSRRGTTKSPAPRPWPRAGASPRP